MNKRKKDFWFVLIGTAITFFLSSIFHFSYEILGSHPILTGLFPISESVWEHLKLPFYSLLLFIMIPQNAYMKNIDVCNKIVMITVSTFISMIVVYFGYYGLKCGLNIESLMIDLLLLIFGLILGLSHSIIYKNKVVSTLACTLGVVYIVGMVFLFYYFSFQHFQRP